MKTIVCIAIVLFSTLIFAQVAFAQDPTPFPSGDSDEVAEDIVDLTVETTEDTTGTVEAFLDRLIATPKSDLMRVLLVVGGVVLLVASWRVYDFVVVIAGFVIGAAIAVSVVTDSNSTILVGAVLLGGLIGAVLSLYVYYIAVFIIGAYIGIVLTGALAAGLSIAPVSPMVLFLGGLIGGFVLISLSFEFLVFLSALVGAQMLSLGMGLDVTWTIIFALIGIALQIGIVHRYHGYSYGVRRHPSNPLRRLRRMFA